ncbi:hypothetical protein X975_21035, partial [Stegodyphus mimosarum]
MEEISTLGNKERNLHSSSVFRYLLQKLKHISRRYSMLNIPDNTNGNLFNNHLDMQKPLQENSTFARIPIVIACSIVVFILFIAGTATTVISYPPPPNGSSGRRMPTALDGDYKLLGPLLLMAGSFFLIIDIVLCAAVTKDAYYSSRIIRPVSNMTTATGQVVGGPFFLAVPRSSDQHVSPLMRTLWPMPNAPLPDFSEDVGSPKRAKVRAATATLSRCHQPPYNPDA